MAEKNSPPRVKLPKGVYRRARRSGPVFIATVRVAGFKDTSKTFAAAADAIAWHEATRAELRAQKTKHTARRDLSTLTLGGLVREFLDDPVPKALKSFGNYDAILSWWTRHYGTVKVLDVSVLVLREARGKLQPGRAPATVNRHLAGMRAAWNWGRNNGLVPTERSWPTKLMLTEPAGRSRHLDDDELTALLKVAKAESCVFHAMVVVSLATGMRQGELLRLKWSDIDFDRQRIQILIAKNKTPRAVHLPPVASDALKALKKAGVVSTVRCFLREDGKPYTKDSMMVPWRHARKAAGLQDFRWHDLRHSCASFLAQKGASLLEIGSVLGHKSPSVTLRYAHLVQGAPVTGHGALDSMLKGKLS